MTPRPQYRDLADVERDYRLRRTARQIDAFPPIKPQDEIDREEARAIRYSYRALAVAVFAAVTLTVALIEIDPIRWLL